MVDQPTPAQIAGYAAAQYPSADEMDTYAKLMQDMGKHYDRLAELPDRPVELRHPDRDSGHLPTAEDDPLRALVQRCTVKGSPDGPLAGIRVGVKEVLPVAQVPMSIPDSGDGGPVQVVPTEDAVVVERLLDAGVAIVATTRNSFPGLGPALDTDPLHPLDARFSPGGSSGGSAVAVATGLIDAALGTDGAGSVRIPAAWCGLVGMKATRGLVPGHGNRSDATGPITVSVADSAAMLDALAGPDWRDGHPAPAGTRDRSYVDAAGDGIAGLRVAVIAESLEPVGCTPATLESFAAAERLLSELGADVRRVSVPLWAETQAIFWPVFLHRVVLDVAAFGAGYRSLGRTEEALASALTRQYHDTYKRSMRLLVDHIRDSYGGMHITRAQNLARALCKDIDDVLATADVLVMPTTPTGPFDLSAAPYPVDIACMNTWAFNLTGHPALSVPTGVGDGGFPFSLQIVGRPFDEFTLYRAGFAVEAASDRPAGVRTSVAR